MTVCDCYNLHFSGPVAQLVEQRIENPRVGSSILPQATKYIAQLFSVGLFFIQALTFQMLFGCLIFPSE